MSKVPTDRGGIEAVLAQYDARRAPFDYAPGEGLPPLDTDLAALAVRRVADPGTDPAEAAPFRSSYHRKRHALRTAFAGQSELACLNALLIAHLRKRAWPAQAPALFQRIWAEEGRHLLGMPDPRWLVSSLTTFGDHGVTTAQRATGMALSTLFGAMKLYETERLYSGTPPDRAFTLDGRAEGPLPLSMDRYALGSGGLDVNLVARLWRDAERDPVIAPLAHHLLEALLQDDRTVLKRLATMRQRKARRAGHPAETIAPVQTNPRARSAGTLRWGVVATIRAPLRQIARFAAHHLALGAHHVEIYLDEPDTRVADALGGHPRIGLVQCDAAYWQATGKTRMEAHQRRQSHNATRSLRRLGASLDWLCHIDCDEFLLCDRPVAEALAALPDGTAIARLPPAEALAREDALPCAFKLTHKQAGRRKAQLAEIYPSFGSRLPGGFLGHTNGKLFARTGIPHTRLDIHTLKYRGTEATNSEPLPGGLLAHLHAPSWAEFRERLAFRRTSGSYRAQADRRGTGPARLIDDLAATEGEPGLRRLFDEVCADSPRLRRALAERDMLVEHPLDLDATVARVFGALP